MKLFFFPTLYKDGSGSHVDEDGLFVKLKTKVPDQFMSWSGTQCHWVKVAKVFPYIYEPIEDSFYDIEDLFTRVKK